MIHYIRKDITTVEAGIVAHGCNCQGKMGAGVALAIRKRWPIAYKAYRSHWEKFQKQKETLLGFVVFVDTQEGIKASTIGLGLELFIANIFTQIFYGRDGARYASPDAIKQGLRVTLEFAKSRRLPLYIPRIGCSLGGLTWETDVKPIVEELALVFPEVDINVCDL